MSNSLPDSIRDDIRINSVVNITNVKLEDGVLYFDLDVEYNGEYIVVTSEYIVVTSERVHLPAEPQWNDSGCIIDYD